MRIARGTIFALEFFVLSENFLIAGARRRIVAAYERRRTQIARGHVRIDHERSVVSQKLEYSDHPIYGFSAFIWKYLVGQRRYKTAAEAAVQQYFGNSGLQRKVCFIIAIIQL